MGYTVGTYPGEIKKSLPRSSSPVLTAHQGASSRVLKGHPGIHLLSIHVYKCLNSFFDYFIFNIFFMEINVLDNIPSLPDIPAVKEKLAKNTVQQKKTSNEDSGILNIENEAPKAINAKVI